MDALMRETAIFRVADFGAKGDGVTDDGTAFWQTLQAALALPANVYKEIRLEAGRTYRIKTVRPETLDQREVSSLFFLQDVRRLTVSGERSTLLMTAPHKVFLMENCEEICFKGICVDYFPKPFVRATVTAICPDENALEMKLVDAGGLGFEAAEYIPTDKDFFAFPNEAFGRNNYFIAAYRPIGEGTYRVILEERSRYRITESQMQIGDEFILPYVGCAHNMGMAFEISCSGRIEISQMTIYSLPHFAFLVYANHGDICFRDVHFSMERNGGVQLVCWRDGFHVKDNTATVTWENCSFDPIGDDCFNFSCVVCTVTEVMSNRAVRIVPSERQLIQQFSRGDKLIVYDLQSGQLIGETTLQSWLIDPHYEGGELTFSEPLDGLHPGQTIGFYYHNNPQYIVKNCRINGTLRVRLPALFDHCRIQALWCYIGNEAETEGPVPKSITFKECDFTGSRAGAVDVNTISLEGKPPAYKCQRIVFNRCTLPERIFSTSTGQEQGVCVL